MRRREYLIASAALVPLAGCAAGDGEDPGDGDEDAEEGPAFEVVEYDFPDEVESGRPWSWSITVENVGNAAGTYDTAVFVARPVQTTDHVAEIRLDIPPGETETYEAEAVPWADLGEHEYEFLGEAETVDISVVGATLAIGDSYRNSRGFVMTVDALHLVADPDERDVAGAEHVGPPDEGNQWAIVEIDVLHDANRYPDRDDGRPVPRREAITVTSGDDQWDHDSRIREGAYRAYDLDQGDRREGWIAYEIPDDLERGELAVRYDGADPDTERVAVWYP